MEPFLLRGHVLAPRTDGGWDHWPDGAVRIEAGRVTWMGPSRLRPAGRVVDRRPDLMLPGLVDMHAHVPQLPACGVHGASLLEWLHTWIYPLEAAFRGERARRIARAFFQESRAEGVTTSWLYASAWPESVEIVLDEAKRAGVKAHVGHPLMDVEVYRDDLRRLPLARRTARVIAELEAFRREPRFVATPRFALSCTPALLEACASFPRVQTHLAENPRECAEVKRRFGRPYLEVYERAGLVRDGAVFAHCIHLQRREVARLSRSVRVHCPTSNLFLGSGVMRWNGPGRLALGSDVGAGWTLSPFEVMRCSLAQGTGAAPADLLRAGCGRLAPGEPADAVILGAGVILPEGAPDVEGTADLIDRIVHRGGRAAVREVYVDGRAL